MKQFKIVFIFISIFLLILIAAYSYDTKQRINALTSDLNKFDQEISGFETKYLDYLKKLNLTDSEIIKLQSEYQESPAGEVQQGVFTEIVLRVNLSKKEMTSGQQAIIDNLDGLANRRKLVSERRMELVERLEKTNASLGAKLIVF